jgi:hypothetical protein
VLFDYLPGRSANVKDQGKNRPVDQRTRDKRGRAAFRLWKRAEIGAPWGVSRLHDLSSHLLPSGWLDIELAWKA